MDITAIIREVLEQAHLSTDKQYAAQLAEDIAPRLARGLDAAGYTLKKKPASRATKPAEPVEELVLTGDAALDTFIETHHRPDWRKKLAKALQKTRPGMMTMPSPPPGLPRKPMTQAERAALWEAHRVQHHSS